MSAAILNIFVGSSIWSPCLSTAEEFDKSFWTGASVTQDSWLLYSGGTFAPFGHIHANGVRMRAWGGYGNYSYNGNSKGTDLPFKGTITLLDAMVGYHHQFGPLTVKGFIGLAMIEHDISPRQAEPATAGRELGPKVQTELWYDAGNRYWASLNGSFTTAHNTYAARTRIGWRLSDTISLGPELAIDDNTVEHIDLESAYARGGMFATYSWSSGELSVSGGLSVDTDNTEGPYVTLNYYTNF